MNLIEFARDTLEDYRRRLYRTLDGLTFDELNWRPNPGANSIAFVVWHTSRVEDRLSQVFCQGVPDIWVSDQWHQRLDLAYSAEAGRLAQGYLQGNPEGSGLAGQRLADPQ